MNSSDRLDRKKKVRETWDRKFQEVLIKNKEGVSVIRNPKDRDVPHQPCSRVYHNQNTLTQLGDVHKLGELTNFFEEYFLSSVVLTKNMRRKNE